MLYAAPSLVARVLCLLVALTGGFSHILQGQEAERQLQEEIAKIIRFEQPVDFSVTPGVWVGVYDSDVMCILMFGEADGKEAVFELGSVTKPIIAWLVLEALDSLGLEMSTPLCYFLPDFLCTQDLSRLTVAHVIEHRAGMSRLPEGIGVYEADVQDPYATYSQQDLIDDLLQTEAVPGMYGYSHTGYALLGWIFERVGGLEFFLEKKLVRPMGLDHTGLEPDSTLTPGHGLDGRKQPPWHSGALMPAFGLRSNAPDMIRFMRTITDTLICRLPSMTPSLRKKIKEYSRAGIFHVEAGWFVIPFGRVPVYYHNGRTGGHYVSVAFSPRHDKGVVVLSNGAKGSGDLSLSVLRMLLRGRG